MKIDLQKLGLTSDSTFEEIQNALNGQTFYSEDELTTEKNQAAAGARKAAIAETKKHTKNVLSDEDMKDFKQYKQNTKLETLKKDKTLSKFSEADFNLIARAYKLTDIEDQTELENVIKDIAKNEASRMNSGKPEEVKVEAKKVEEKETKTEAKATYVPGELNIFASKSTSEEE